ncbi:MAG: hypothetical protein IKZ30_00685 [Oscillospiraceae bacterium]|nr:hypothetical protein [Oscillospiraceae bacterium]
MSDNQFENRIRKENSSTYFSLEDILTEYSSPMAEYDPPEEKEELHEQSKRIVLEAYEKTEQLASSEISSSTVYEIVETALSEVEHEGRRSTPKKSRKFPKKKHGKTVGAPPVQASKPEPVKEERIKEEPVRIIEDDSAEPDNLDIGSLDLLGIDDVDDSDVKIAGGPAAFDEDSDMKIAPAIGSAKTAGAVKIVEEDDVDADVRTVRVSPYGKQGISEYEVRELLEQDERLEYASASAVNGEHENFESTDINKERRKKVKDQYVSPMLALLALMTVRVEKRAKADTLEPTVEREEPDDSPEMPAKKAVKFYSSQMRSFAMRTKIALVVSLVAVYITFAHSSWLPLFGVLGKSTPVAALVLMICLLSVMLSGLDVFTSGIMALVRKRPTFDSLVAVSCVFSLIDAMVIAAGAASEAGLPLCAVSALSMTSALWGAQLTCAGFRSSFRVLTAKKLWSISSEPYSADARTLIKTEAAPERFVSKSEEADRPEYVFNLVAPVLLVAALIFSILASFLHKQAWAFVHCLSLMTAICAVLSGPVCFALPFALTSKSLSHVGGAIAGWSGIRDIGKSKKAVVKDDDIFTTDTVQIMNVRILENMAPNKVIGYAGSIVAASGGAAAGAFAELMRKNACSMSRIENFEAHDGCGMTAVINGEGILVGNGGFMNLMGIRVPQKLNTQNSVYIAISGTLAGIFNLEYKATAKSQKAINTIMKSHHEPLFAIRDFNLTPVELKRKFQISTDKMDFPKLSERFRISGMTPDEPRKISAVTAREGLNTYADIANKGRRVFTAVNVLTALSVAMAAVGLVVVFFLSWLGLFDSCSAANILTSMLLCLIPTLVISWSVQR